jgi:hypothetical protein
MKANVLRVGNSGRGERERGGKEEKERGGSYKFKFNIQLLSGNLLFKVLFPFSFFLPSFFSFLFFFFCVFLNSHDYKLLYMYSIYISISSGLL